MARRLRGGAGGHPGLTGGFSSGTNRPLSGQRPFARRLRTARLTGLAVKVTVVAVGRLKAGPERELLDRYRDRAGRAGRAAGPHLRRPRDSPRAVRGAPDSRKAEEAAADPCGGPRRCGPDRPRRARQSPRQPRIRRPPRRLARCRDEGPGRRHRRRRRSRRRRCSSEADLRLAFGAMTWPHQIVRILLAEQLYRAGHDPVRPPLSPRLTAHGKPRFSPQSPERSLPVAVWLTSR